MEQTLTDLIDLAAEFVRTSPKMSAVLITLIVLIVVPKALAAVSKSRFPRFAAGCEMVCTDLIKLATLVIGAIRKAPPVPAFALVFVVSISGGLMSCAGMKATFLKADTSDGDHWKWCVKWTEDASIAEFWQLTCAKTSFLLEQRKAEIQHGHPRALFKGVSQ